MNEWADQVRHCVYVVLLDPKVKENKHFREQNPDWDGKKKCYYVGRTGKTPEERFREHKQGYKAGKGIVRDYGLRLEPGWYDYLKLMTFADSERKEVEHAEMLRQKGYGVYQN